jgi:Cof subfamily protein (haloacid dehalogenase superfamily)
MEKGILFSVASGRQLFNLEETFAPIAENTLFIAENGSYVRFRGRDVHINPIDKTATNQLIEIARTIEHTGIVLCCKNAAYIESKNPEFANEVGRFFSKLVKTDDLTLVDDTILKLGIYDYLDAETNSFPYFNAFTTKYNIVVSGKNWVDITNSSSSKGSAIEKIQAEMGFKRDEIMAFGDFLNDYEMMEAAGHSYAMKNAHPEILRISRFVTEFDNNNNGVVDTIQKVCFS